MLEAQAGIILADEHGEHPGDAHVQRAIEAHGVEVRGVDLFPHRFAHIVQPLA